MDVMDSTAKETTGQPHGSDQDQDTKNKRAAGNITLRIVLGVLISVGAAGVFAWIWDLVKDKGRDTTTFDDTLLRWMHLHQTPWVTALARGLAWLGNPPTIIGIAVVAILVGLFWRKVRGAAWTLPIAIIGAGIIIQGVKMVFHRPRPTLFHPLLHESGYSFPSGHSLISVVVYGLLGYFVMHLFKAHAARIAVGILTILLILLIGLSRVYVGVHFPTDVLAGWTGGLPWLFTCLAIHEWLTRRYADAGEPVLHNPPSLGKVAASVKKQAS